MKKYFGSISLKSILIAIGVGIWVIVLQNAGIIPTKQNVYVKGGYINADVNGRVDADVKGSVSVTNTVDVNLAEIQGRPAACRTSYSIDGRQYHALDVSAR